MTSSLCFRCYDRVAFIQACSLGKYFANAGMFSACGKLYNKTINAKTAVETM